MVSYVRGGFAKLLLAFLVISDIAVPHYAAALTIPRRRCPFLPRVFVLDV